MSVSTVEPVRKTGRPPGTPKTGGRKAGTPNKVTADLKSMILGALDAAGGAKYLQQQATANPASFLTLIGKVLPMQIAGDSTAPLVIKILTVTTEQERAKVWKKAE